MTAVDVPSAAEAMLAACWQRCASKGASLYHDADAFLAFVRQALERDIRSVHQRLHVGPAARDDAALAAAAQDVQQLQRSNNTSAGAEDAADAPRAVSDTVGQRSCNVDATEGPRATPAQHGVGLSNLRRQHVAELPRRPDANSAVRSLAEQQGVYHVVLEGIDISYDIDTTGAALVRTAMQWQRP